MLAIDDAVLLYMTTDEGGLRNAVACSYHDALSHIRETCPGAVRGARLRTSGGTEYTLVYRDADARRTNDERTIARVEDVQLASMNDDQDGAGLPIAVLVWVFQPQRNEKNAQKC